MRTRLPHAEARPNRSGKLQTAVGAAILAVCATALLWWLMRPGTEPTIVVGQEVAEAFLKQIREGRADSAWESTTAEFKSAQGKESFLRAVKPLKFFQQPLEFASSQSVQVGEENRSEFVFRAPTGEMVRIVIGREGNDWKVDRWVR